MAANIDFPALLNELAAQRQQKQDSQNRKNEASRVKEAVDKVTKCDGSSVTATREWILNMELVSRQLRAALVVRVARRTVLGPLMHDVERFLDQVAEAEFQGDREQVTWARIQAHVRAAFLHLNETAALQDNLVKMTKKGQETVVGFSRRYREAADHAYPVGNRNPDQQRIMVKGFLNGIQDSRMAWELIRANQPNTLAEAMDGVAQLAGAEETMERMGLRREEPMELAAVRTTPAPALSEDQAKMVRDIIRQALPPPVSTVETASPLDELTETLKEVCIAAVRQGQHVDRRDKRNVRNMPAEQEDPWGDGRPAWDQQGRPRCYRCSKYGHLSRECGQRGDTRNQRPTSQNQKTKPSGNGY